MSRLLQSKRALFIALSASAMVAAAASGAYAATASPGAAAHNAAAHSAAAHSAAAASSPAGPAAFSGFHDAPISLPSSLGTIASLRIPAGSYVIFAKLTLWNGQNIDDTLTCKLVAGGDFDESITVLTGNTVPYADYAATSLNVVHHFNRPGRIRLQCTGGSVTTTASWIKITAIRVGSLSNTGI
jgi:hypothetical protein